MQFEPEEYIQRLKEIKAYTESITPSRAKKDDSIFFELKKELDHLDEELYGLTRDIFRRSCIRRFELYKKWSESVERGFLGKFAEFCDHLDTQARRYTFGHPQQEIIDFNKTIQERYISPPSKMATKEVVENFTNTLFFVKLWDIYKKEDFPIIYTLLRLESGWFIKEKTTSKNIKMRIFSINHMYENEINIDVSTEIRPETKILSKRKILCVNFRDGAEHANKWVFNPFALRDLNDEEWAQLHDRFPQSDMNFEDDKES